MIRKIIILFFFTQLSAEIVIDGKLDEIEWDSAGVIDTFFVTEPLTYATPEVETEVLYFANEDGIYFGFKNYQQPIENQTTLLHKRDVMDASADRDFLAIDRKAVLVSFKMEMSSANTFNGRKKQIIDNNILIEKNFIKQLLIKINIILN